jgi:predicted RNA-binding protein with TRAM domain
MVQIPDSLRTLFAAEIKQYDDSFVIEVPKQEVSRGDVALGEMYQVALFSEQSQSRPQDDSSTASSQSPPVNEGDTKVVTIETTGDQGDGIARIERGYVVIVPGTVPGDGNGS